MSELLTRIFRRGSATFYNSSRLFPPDVRARVTALYAFVRVADDFVDADPQDRDGFAAFRAEYEAARRGVPARSPVIAAFLDLSRERGFEDAWVDAFLDAMAQDIWKTEYATLEETLAYVYGSAEVVGLMMSRLLGLPNAAEPSARLLGRAFQYVNFVRDLHEDFGLGRTYLPREDLQAAGLPGLGLEAALAHPQAFRAFVAGQINRYRTYACEGMEGFRFIPRETLAPIHLAAEMYEHTARVIERDPFVVYRRKVKPTRTRLLLSAGRQILRRGIPGHPGPDPMGQAAEGHDAPA